MAMEQNECRAMAGATPTGWHPAGVRLAPTGSRSRSLGPLASSPAAVYRLWAADPARQTPGAYRHLSELSTSLRLPTALLGSVRCGCYTRRLTRVAACTAFLADGSRLEIRL